MVELTGLKNAIAALAADASNESTEVKGKIDSLVTQIAELQATIDGLVAGAVTQAQIDAATAEIAAVSATIQGISDAADPATPTP